METNTSELVSDEWRGQRSTVEDLELDNHLCKPRERNEELFKRDRWENWLDTGKRA